MPQPILCHLLIGLPGSGKSTFALELKEQISDSVIISTDTIRLRLFGDEAIQGDWNRIENDVIEQVKLAIVHNQVVIYDATNIKAVWRKSFLDKVKDLNAEWIAWWIKTPAETCKKWNKKRSRQVPNDVINIYQEYLEQSPPTIEEGFIAIKNFEPES